MLVHIGCHVRSWSQFQQTSSTHDPTEAHLVRLAAHVAGDDQRVVRPQHRVHALPLTGIRLSA